MDGQKVRRTDVLVIAIPTEVNNANKTSCKCSKTLITATNNKVFKILSKPHNKTGYICPNLERNTFIS